VGRFLLYFSLFYEEMNHIINFVMLPAPWYGEALVYWGVGRSSGGPTTAVAMAIAKGWKDLIGPILVVGTLGYIIGNYVGTTLGIWFSGIM
jgi:uncharacterized membrane protein